MSDKTTDPLAEFDQADADYLNERIGELHYHAKQHEGELCSKLNRARIGGMIEVLSRMGLEVVCDWDRCTKKVTIFSKGDFEFLQKVKRSDKAKKVVRPGTETPEQRAALQEMLRRCDMPTGRSFPAIKCSRPTRLTTDKKGDTMKNDTIKDIINDTRELAATRKNPMTRFALEGLANRLQTLVDEWGTGNGERGTEKKDWLELPRGIKLHRYSNTKRQTHFIGQYRDDNNPGNPNPRRVYEIRVRPMSCNIKECKDFLVEVSEDSKTLFEIQTLRGRAVAEYLGVKALKAWLNYCGDNRRGKGSRKTRNKRHRANLRKRKAEAGVVG